MNQFDRRRRSAAIDTHGTGKLPAARVLLEFRCQADPDRRHSERDGDAFLLDQLQQARRIDVRPRKDTSLAPNMTEEYGTPQPLT